MVTPADVRRLALALPGAAEQPYHGVPSFRVDGKVFANIPDDGHLHLMLPVDEIEAALQVFAGRCEGVRWGKRLAALRVELAAFEVEDLRTLLERAWTDRAPAASREQRRRADRAT